jgi:maltose-binding protein MalE
MSWYKKAQLNQDKVKYGPDGSFFILGKNTKPDEGPWRISYFDENGRGYVHMDYPTYEDALAVFNYTYGSETPP